MGSNDYDTRLKDISFELPVIPFEETVESEDFMKIPIDKLSTLGVGLAEPLRNMVLRAKGGSQSGIYSVFVPKGGTLGKFKDGRGMFGGVVGADKKFTGQAVLNPVTFNPTAVFMAASLQCIQQKLDRIEELQQEMMDFLVQKEKAELRGNLVFLEDIMKNYRFNWNNDLYRNSNHVKVLDIRQAAEQKILFFREQIDAKRKKKMLIHGDGAVKRQTDQLQEIFREYLLALYTHAFSSYLEVMLLANFDTDYLNSIKAKIREYSSQYKELFLACQDQMASYSETSVQSSVLRGLRSAGNVMGKAAAKVPLVKKSSDALAGVGNKFEQIGEQRKENQLSKWNQDGIECVRPFVENIDIVNQFYNNPVRIAFDSETVYIGMLQAN